MAIFKSNEVKSLLKTGCFNKRGRTLIKGVNEAYQWMEKEWAVHDMSESF